VRTNSQIQNQNSWIKFKKFPPMRRLLLSLFCLLALACNRPPPPPFHATDLTGASFGRQLELTDHHGLRRSLADFRGQAVIVYFGYTACPDVCPTTLTRFAAMMRSLGPQAAKVQVLFVSLDPERDSAERLAAFVPWFYPSFLGLRGDVEQTKAVAEEFRVFSSRQEIGGGLGYVLDHSTGAYVFDPAGRLRLFLKDDAAVEDVAADLRLLLAGN
jgi:protein SCO1/2